MRRSPWWLVGLLVLLAFAFQGTRGIWEPDEGRYTATSLNMLDSGDWLLPTLDGERPHLTKPPLTYWAIAASVALLGRDEWAARLPGALAFVGTGLLLFGLGRRLCPARPWLPPLAWGLSLAPLAAANIVSTDTLLAFFETAAMYAFVEWWTREAPDARRWLLAMWVAWGLAFLTKGPPGLLPLAAVVAFLAAHDRARLRGLFQPVGLAVFALVAFGWFAVIVAQQPDRLGYFLGYEVYGRVFTGVHKRNSEWYGGFEVYLPVLLAGALPWWALAVAAAGGPRRAWSRLRDGVRRRDAGLLLLLYWLLVPLAVFFLARSRLHLYVLPLFVPLALLLARPLAGWAWLTDRRLAAVAGVTAAALLALKGVLAGWTSDRDARHMAADLRPVVEAERADAVVFVGMKAFYGLRLYLDVKVESLEIDGHGLEYADRVSGADLCRDLARRGRSLLAAKPAQAAALAAAAAGCGDTELRHVGVLDADGYRLQLHVARPRSPGVTRGGAG
jgi:4-amino-4-deoxy-L-arabinose transferase